ncbi:MAG: hypothetical protein AAFX94_12425, partial [Myxococcota bacterium]
AVFRGGRYSVAVFWGLGAAFKILPLALLAVWWVHRGVRRWMGPGLVASAVFALPVVLVLALGWVPIGSIAVFFEKWRFASPLWLGLEPALGLAMPWVALVGAGLSGLAVLWLAQRGASVQLLVFAGAVPLLWSPVVFPWYLVALLPVAVLVRSGFYLAWVTAIPFTYEILDRYDVDASWEPAPWPVALIAVGWAFGAVRDLGRGAGPSVPLPDPQR